jgi:CubicO group peptidase (beta-lactamase class C family)
VNFDKLEASIFDKLAALSTPALSIAILESDDIVWSRGFGFRSVADRLPATPDTLYDTASITKSFTAAAVLQLAERDVISLDDPVSKYIPKFKIEPFGETVRVKHLLNHTSGIPALESSTRMKALIGTRNDLMPVVSFEDHLLFMNGAEKWVAAKPGERFFYSNEGYALLGLIVQEATGMSYEQYLRANLLEPLDMTRSCFQRADLEADSDVATLYAIFDGKLTPMPYLFRAANSFSGLISCTTDLLKFAAMLANGGAYKGTRVLSPETVALMLTPHDPSGGREGRSRAGYGLEFIEDFYGTTLAGHGGWIDISAGYLGFIPEKRLGVAVQINCAGYLPDFIGMYALALYLGQDADSLPFLVRDQMLNELVGTYRTFRNTMEAKVTRMAGCLILEVKIENHRTIYMPLFPDEITPERRTFYTMNLTVRQTVEFSLKNGQVEMLYDRYLFRKARG